MELLNEVLLDVACGRLKRVAIFMPPRHAKSTMCSRTFPAWYLGRFPDKRLMLASYEAEFAARWGAKARDILRAHGPAVFGVDVAPDQSARNSWSATNGSEMVTMGVGGALTGRGADILLIDDPVKNAEQAASEVYRAKTWDWYTSTAFTRLEPNGAIILIMTRWHEDDLAGRILSPENEDDEEPWTVINLPAIAEEDDPLGRAPGEALWPERYPVEKLVGSDGHGGKKKAVGSYFWNALYQQHPSPVEGNVLRKSWWRYFDKLPDGIQDIIQSWDMTFKDTAGADYVAGCVIARKGADKFILDFINEQMDFTRTLAAVRNLTEKWPKARLKLIEDTANGPAVISVLRRTVPGIVPVTPKGSKLARVMAISPDVEAGNVYLPRNAAWADVFVDQCATFPNAAHDDMVDAMSQGLLRFQGTPRYGSIAKPKGW